jgi:hypothetical protein
MERQQGAKTKGQQAKILVKADVLSQDSLRTLAKNNDISQQRIGYAP